jgi:hypothetical protein
MDRLPLAIDELMDFDLVGLIEDQRLATLASLTQTRPHFRLPGLA